MVANIRKWLLACLVMFALGTECVSAMSDNEKIKEIISNELGVELSEMTPEASLIEDMGADELDVVKILMQVENDLGIVISDDEKANIGTLGDIENAVANARSGNPET